MSEGKMNPERKALLTSALRSGRFRQGNGRLHEITPTGDDLYCCMGVACEVAAENGLEIRRERRSLTGDSVRGGRAEYYDGERFWMPKSVAAWYGLPVDEWEDVNPQVEITHGDAERIEHVQDISYTPTLADLNDDGHASFDIIADIIDREL